MGGTPFLWREVCRPHFTAAGPYARPSTTADSNRVTLEDQLAAEKVTFEILGIDITASSLKQIANKLKDPAAKLAAAAP